MPLFWSQDWLTSGFIFKFFVACRGFVHTEIAAPAHVMNHISDEGVVPLLSFDDTT